MISIMETIKDKIVLIIGATGGIGAEVAKMLHKSGAVVIITGRNLEKLSSLSAELQLPEENKIALDITDETAVTATVNSIIDRYGKIDVLVNAAGIGIIKPFEQLSADEFRQTIDTNLIAAFYILKAVLPPMKAVKKGLIIHIPGVLGKVPMAGAAAYCASKYGLAGMLQSIREEIKRTEIRFTSLYLGGTDSPFWDNIDLRVQRDKMILAEEAAKAIWFLCQQPASGVVSEMVLQPFNHQAI